MDLTETPTVPPSTPDLSASWITRISISGSIQPYGCLLFCTLPSWVVQAASGNVSEFLGRDVQSVLDTTLDSVLPDRTLHDLRNVLQASMVSGSAERLLDQKIDDGPERYDLTVHMAGANAIVEIVPRKGADTLATDPITLVKSMVGRLKRAPTPERFFHLAAHQVRAVTGYDRVMIYKFLPDGSGEVKAEAVRSGLPSFLGLRYPASGNSAEARSVYRRQSLGMIPDVDCEPVPLVARPGRDVKPDLSLATLCCISPLQLDVLRNMGCLASLTISLMMGDHLWGLIACHHSSPRRISASTCAAVELFGQIFSLQIDAKEKAAEMIRAADLHEAHGRLVDAMSPDLSIVDDPGRFQSLVEELIPCDGYGVWTERGFVGAGTTPPADVIPDLVRHLGEKNLRTPYATDTLSRELSSAGTYVPEASGVLAIPLPRHPRQYLLFFRREMVRTVTWGWDPTEPLAEPAAAPTEPRRSLDAWSEVVSGRSVPWRPAEVQVAEKLRISLLELMLRRADLADSERRAAQPNGGLA